MPNTGDYIKKERDALDLIIKMRKSNEQKSAGTAEIIVFIVIPIVLALGVMRFREIKDFAAHNKQVSAVIKMVYPQWDEAKDLPAPVMIDPATGLPINGVVPVSDPAAAPAVDASGKPIPTQSAPVTATPEPDVTGPKERGSLLH
jgi:hypothetical protein